MVGLNFQQSSLKGGHSASAHTRAISPPSRLDYGCDGGNFSNHLVSMSSKVIPYSSRGEGQDEPRIWTTSWRCWAALNFQPLTFSSRDRNISLDWPQAWLEIVCRQSSLPPQRMSHKTDCHRKGKERKLAIFGLQADFLDLIIEILVRLHVGNHSHSGRNLHATGVIGFQGDGGQLVAPSHQRQAAPRNPKGHMEERGMQDPEKKGKWKPRANCQLQTWETAPACCHIAVL
nr:uncharacterized protein LOC105716104 [Aotus nancymaae]